MVARTRLCHLHTMQVIPNDMRRYRLHAQQVFILDGSAPSYSDGPSEWYAVFSSVVTCDASVVAWRLVVVGGGTPR